MLIFVPLLSPHPELAELYPHCPARAAPDEGRCPPRPAAAGRAVSLVRVPRRSARMCFGACRIQPGHRGSAIPMQGKETPDPLEAHYELM